MNRVGRWQRLGRAFTTASWPVVAGLVLLFGSSVYFLFLSWLKWPDILVDFGRELYIPWRLSQGDVLYRDIYFYYGPLSKYFHALLFKLFSPSLHLLIVVNFLILGVFVGLIFHLLRTFASRTAVWTAAGVFLSLFAFAQYTGFGNYNFICPYAHELVLGLVCSFAFLILFLRFADTPSLPLAIITGFLAGAVFLTKVEVFIALAGSLCVAVGVLVMRERLNGLRRFTAGQFIAFGAGFFLPLAMFWVYFAFNMGLWQALKVIFLPYAAIFNASVSSNVFYKTFSGLADPGQSLFLMGKSTLGYCIVAVVVYALARAVALSGRWKVRIAVAVLACVLSAWSCWYVVIHYIPSYEIFRPLPIFSLAAIIYFVIKVFSSPAEAFRRHFRLFVFAVFSFLMLFKILLYGHIYHTGFVLALPAVLLLVVLAMDDILDSFVRMGAERVTGQALVYIAIMAIIFSYGLMDRYYYSYKNSSFGHSLDRFLTYDARASANGPVLGEVLNFLDKIPENATVALFPEGVMLNYLSRHKASTPYFEFSPSFFDMASEGKVLADFKAHPPDYVVLVDRDTSEHGARYFGQDYACKLFAWMTVNYLPVRQIGPMPFSGKGFGALIGRRK